MTEVETIPLAPYNGQSHIFLPLEGQANDTIWLICSAEDWHWKLDPQTLAGEWPDILASMREHQRTHASQS